MSESGPLERLAGWMSFETNSQTIRRSDITTTDANHDQPRRVEIWMLDVDGRFFHPDIARLGPRRDNRNVPVLAHQALASPCPEMSRR